MRPTLGYGCLTTLGSTAEAAECDYPAEEDVERGVVYGNSVYTGTYPGYNFAGDGQMSSEEDVRAAIFGYINDNFSEVSDVLWPATEVDAQALDEWIEPQVLLLNSPARRSSDVFEEYEVQVNVFVRDVGTNTYRGQEICDVLRVLLHDVFITTALTTYVRIKEARSQWLGSEGGVNGWMVRAEATVE